MVLDRFVHLVAASAASLRMQHEERAERGNSSRRMHEDAQHQTAAISNPHDTDDGSRAAAEPQKTA